MVLQAHAIKEAFNQEEHCEGLGDSGWSQEEPAREPRDREARPWACRQLQAQLQAPAQQQLPLQAPEEEEQEGLEKMKAFDVSSGYESNLASLDNVEYDDDDISSEELASVGESTQLELNSSLCIKEQQKEEQQEVPKEEDQSCVPGCEQAEGESVCGVELAGAPVTSQPLPGWLPGVSSGRGSCFSSYTGPCCNRGTQSQ